MLLVMNTDLTRDLAAVYEERSQLAVTIQTRLRANLDRAALDDYLSVGDQLGSLSEHLHIGGVILRRQADLMDGLDVDVATLATDFGVEKWKARRQLDGLANGTLEIGDVLMPLAGDWATTTTTGLDTTIRDFLPDAPLPGTDPDFDALIQRLDGWLLSPIVDGSDERGRAAIDDDKQRQADLIKLAYFMGMENLATKTRTVEYTERYEHGRGDDHFRQATVELPLRSEDYGATAYQFVAEGLRSERKLSRAVALPAIGDLLDLTTYEEMYSRHVEAGEQELAWRTVHRTADEMAKYRAEMNQEWSGLAWLPAFLVGQGPSRFEEPGMKARLVRFAKQFGFDRRADTDDFSAALQHIESRNLVANALEAPAPIHKAALPFRSEALDTSIAYGTQQGVLTAELTAEARGMAAYLTGLDPSTDPASLSDAQREALAPDLDTAEFIGLIATRVPRDRLPDARILQALSYVNRGKTVAARMNRIEKAILGLQTVATVGEPAMTQHQWIQALPASLGNNERIAPYIHDGHQSAEMQWLLDHSDVPGYHKSPDWRPGGGKIYWHLVNDVDGAVDDFIVEKIPRKKSLFGKIALGAMKAAIGYFVPPAGVMLAVMDAGMAAAAGNWKGAALGAVGVVAAGAATWATTAGATANGAAATANNTLNAARSGTLGSFDAVAGAAATANATQSTANFAGSIAQGAIAVEKGVAAGFAFAEDDVVGGLINSVASFGAGAGSFGYSNAASFLTKTSSTAAAINTTYHAADSGDIGAAVAGGLQATSGLVSLTGTAGTAAGRFSDATNTSLQRLAVTLEDVSDWADSANSIARGIHDDNWGQALGGAFQLGANALNTFANEEGLAANLVFTRDEDEKLPKSAAELRRAAELSDAAAKLSLAADAIDNEDYLGGAALLSGAVAGLTNGTDFDSATIQRLDHLTNIADKLAKAGPGADTATLVGLVGGDLQALSDTFRDADTEATLRMGDPRRAREQVDFELGLAKAGLAALQEIQSLGSANGLVRGILGASTADYKHAIAVLSQERKLLDEELARRAAAAPRPVLRPPFPSHIPVLRPPFPSHIPVPRPGDLIPLPDGGTVLVTPQGPVLLPPGTPLPRPAGQAPSIQDFPWNRVRIYEQLVPGLHVGQLVGSWVDDFTLTSTLVAAHEVGPYTIPYGPLLTLGQERSVQADGRMALIGQVRGGFRLGVDGPLIPNLLDGGLSYDVFPGLPFLDDVPSGLHYSSIAPAGQVPSTFPSLLDPRSWNAGHSVRLNAVDGYELHTKLGSSGDVRGSGFGDYLDNGYDTLEVTHVGNGVVKVTRGIIDLSTLQGGGALNFPLPLGAIESGRLAASAPSTTGTGQLNSYYYQLPGQAPQYLTHLRDLAPLPEWAGTATDMRFGLGGFSLDLTAGLDRPRVNSNVSFGLQVPHSRHVITENTNPDGSVDVDFSSSGEFWNAYSGRTSLDRFGSINGINVEGQITPLLAFEPIDFTLDQTAVETYLMAPALGKDPVAALRGLAGIPDTVYSTPLHEAEFADTLGDIFETSDYWPGALLPGNIGVEETIHGGRFLTPGPAPQAFDDGRIHAGELFDGAALFTLDSAANLFEGGAATVSAVVDAPAWLIAQARGYDTSNRSHAYVQNREQLFDAADRTQERIDWLLDTGGSAVDWVGEIAAGDRSLVDDATAAGRWAWYGAAGYFQGLNEAYQAGDGQSLMYDGFVPLGAAATFVVGRGMRSGAKWDDLGVAPQPQQSGFGFARPHIDAVLLEDGTWGLPPSAGSFGPKSLRLIEGPPTNGSRTLPPPPDAPDLLPYDGRLPGGKPPEPFSLTESGQLSKQAGHLLEYINAADRANRGDKVVFLDDQSKVAPRDRLGRTPPNPNKRPDYTVNGLFTDAYSPITSNPGSALREALQKVSNGQTQRVDIDLDRSDISLHDIQDHFQTKFGGDLNDYAYTAPDGTRFPVEEITVLKNGRRVTLFNGE